MGKGTEFARADASYYGGAPNVAPVKKGNVVFNAHGIKFNWCRDDDQNIGIPAADIRSIHTDTDRHGSVANTVLFGLAGLAASAADASLIVETTDGRTLAFGLHGVTAPQLIGVLSTYGLYRTAGPTTPPAQS